MLDYNDRGECCQDPVASLLDAFAAFRQRNWAWGWLVTYVHIFWRWSLLVGGRDVYHHDIQQTRARDFSPHLPFRGARVRTS